MRCLLSAKTIRPLIITKQQQTILHKAVLNLSMMEFLFNSCHDDYIKLVDKKDIAGNTVLDLADDEKVATFLRLHLDKSIN